MTARAAVARLHARGWTTTQIARALGRNHGQISQIAAGSKPGTALAPALSTLARRQHVPAAGEPIKPLAGRHAPPPRRSPGVELPPGAARQFVGRGKTRRAVYRYEPAGGQVTDGDALRLLEGLRGKQAAVTVEATFLLTTTNRQTGEVSEDTVEKIIHLYPRGWDADAITATIREAGLAELVAQAAYAAKYITQTWKLISINWVVVEQVLPGSVRSLPRAA